MRDLSRNDGTSIMHLPDDCLAIIFHDLESCIDRESFGLTCHRWLQIQNVYRRSLHFQLLRRFQHLEYLSLSGCSELNHSGLTRLLSYGSNLRKLNLDCCFKVTDYGLSLVAAGCPSLMTISLYRCLNVTDKGLETLSSACLSMKCVNLSYCSQISDKGLKAFTQWCRQLQSVNISHCEGISGVGFEGCSKTLAYVEADSCKLKPEGVMGIVSGGGIEYLDVSCLSWSLFGDPLPGIGFSSGLKILNFRLCRTVSDTSIVAIAKGCPLLEEWNLALCHEVRISGWQAIGLYCQNLKRLHVNRCRNLSDNGLLALRDGCKSLSILYLNGCVRLTSTALELFKFHRANVCIKEIEVMSIKPYFEFR
ncbi:F-box/LRR-repeat protein 12 [Gastrolobium bilobum]|uniref:F-box/LRR-repeat protein 12 n=1 Tax=Gastrolobium bilobum TaxID=150636 RepID=UPI002AB308FB|nr:F-box/LRR-repeat protein 12 [Gastrolobium bilobum]